MNTHPFILDLAQQLVSQLSSVSHEPEADVFIDGFNTSRDNMHVGVTFFSKQSAHQSYMVQLSSVFERQIFEYPHLRQFLERQHQIMKKSTELICNGNGKIFGNADLFIRHNPLTLNIVGSYNKKGNKLHYIYHYFMVDEISNLIIK